MSLIKYPEYPQQLPRNYDYEVSVTQGDETITLPVYNPSRQSNTFSNVKNADAYRRFCEFSFEGEITVTVTSRLPFSSYAVLPTSKRIPSTTFGNKIIFTLNQPTDVVVRLNEDKNTILAIFAEAPETDIPDENDENVIFFKAGLNNSPFYNLDSRAVMQVPANKTVYLAPGALVEARLETFGDNVKFCGRGAFIDPRLDRNADFTYMFYCKGERDKPIKGLEFKDLRFLDAHCFNLCFCYVEGMVADKVKLLSNQISTDGMSFWGTVAKDVLMKDMFMHITDNAFVCSTGENMVAKNCFVGTDYGIFYPQGNIESITFEDIDLFRCGDFFRATEYGVQREWKNITVNNVRAQDALRIVEFVHLRTQGEGEKNVYINNVSLPKVPMSFNCYGNTKDAKVRVKNVFVGDTALTEEEQFSKINKNENKNEIIFEGKDGTYSPVMYKTFPGNFDGEMRVYVGDYLVPNFKNKVIEENGEILLPAEILKEVNKPETDKEHVSISYLKEIGIDVKVDGKKIVLEYPLSDENFITDPSFEDAYNKNIPELEKGVTMLCSLRWNTFDFAIMHSVENEDIAHSGKRVFRVGKDYRVRQCGITHELFPKVLKCGPGVYHVKCMARLGEIKNPPDKNVYMGIVQGGWRFFNDDDPENIKPVGINDVKEFELTDEWQELSYDVRITDTSLDGYDRCFFFIGPKTKVVENPADPKNRYLRVMDFYIDDVSVTFTKE